MFWAGGVAASWLKNIRNALLDHASDSNVTSRVSDSLLVWFFFFPPQFFAPAVKICSFSLWLWAVARIRRATEQCGMSYLKFHWIFSKSNKPIRYSKISFNRDKFGGCHFCFSGLPAGIVKELYLTIFFCASYSESFSVTCVSLAPLWCIFPAPHLPVKQVECFRKCFSWVSLTTSVNTGVNTAGSVSWTEWILSSMANVPADFFPNLSKCTLIL